MDEWNEEMAARRGDDLPAGTVTFVLGDVVRSTAMWEAHPEQASEAIAFLDGVVDKLLVAHNGARAVEQGEGDSFVAAFARALDAAEFATALQRGIATSSWPSDVQFAVRCAIHTGEARLNDGFYRGESLNRCARIRALAHGGQILVSGATAELVVGGLNGGAFLKDLGVHRLRDLSRPDHIRQLCDPALPIEFAPLASLDHLPNNLPRQITSFIGREDEMSAIAELVAAHRVVTLTGAGGSGKTRLALHVAARMLDRYSEGCWLVDLATVTDPQQVGRELATVLGVHEMPQQDVVDAVEHWLRDQTMLLLVDNCEHLIDVSAQIIGRLAATCPDVTFLATSREPLGIGGEITYRVPSLPLPEADDADCPSIELFAARAAAVRPSFAITPDNVTFVASICRRLDGLPLAIELAAARCRALSPRQISEQLGSRLSLLAGGARNALPRQRTLEASVAWSVDLLDDDERALLRRLSVFSGSFSLEAAETVGAFDGVDSWQVVDMLTGLVDKSLVQVDESDDDARYRLLETVRHFVAMQLADHGESERARDAHARHYCTLVASVAPELIGPNALQRFAELDRDRTNLWNSLLWLIDTGQGAEAIAQAARLTRLWSRAASGDVHELLLRVLALEGGEPRDRARVMLAWCEIAWVIGDLESNARAIDEFDNFVRVHDLEELSEHPTLMKGWRGMLTGDPDTIEILRQAAVALRARGDYYWANDAWFGAANALMESCDYRAAEECYEEAEADGRRSGDPLAQARTALLHAGNVMQMGEPDRAERMIDAIDPRHYDVVTSLFGSIFRGWIDAIRGETDTAKERARRAMADAQRHGTPLLLGWASYVDAVACRLSEEHEALGERLDEYGPLMELVGLPWGTAWCRAVQGELVLAAGDPAGAHAHVAAAYELATTHPFARYAIVRTLLTRSRIRRAADEDGAQTDAYDALASADTAGLEPETIEALELIASFHAETGDTESAARLFGFSDAARRERNLMHPPLSRRETALASALLTDRHDADELRQLSLEGAQLTLNDAVSYARRGRGTRRRPSTGWRSLTPTELAVVDLVAEGCKNAEIAQRMFSSVATVKTHLAHIFAKLEVSTRAELASRAARRS